MSYRKTKLIQEKNLLLERKYILEQAPPPPLPVAPASPAGVPPPPVSGTPQPPSIGAPTGQTTSGVKKFTETDIIKAAHCSTKRFKIDEQKYEKKEEKIQDKTYVYYLTEKKDMILCREKPTNNELD